MRFHLSVLLLLPLLLIFCLESLIKLFIPKKKKSVAGEIVLVTGAGHGIGRLTAHEFAKRKSKLVLWDINKHGIEETAAECRKLGAQVHAFVVDCSNREDIYNSAKKVKEEVGDVSILVNNAGVVYTSDLFATQDPQIEKTFEVNVLAHFWTAKAFLPAMMRTNHGHVVTVASAAGHTVVPFLLAYCSSKFAAVGFHRALTEELAALERTGVKTTCLCPNFINTGFIKNPSTKTVYRGSTEYHCIHQTLSDPPAYSLPSAGITITRHHAHSQSPSQHVPGQHSSPGRQPPDQTPGPCPLRLPKQAL